MITTPTNPTLITSIPVTSSSNTTPQLSIPPSLYLPAGVPMSPYQPSSMASPIPTFIRPTGSYGSFGNLSLLDSTTGGGGGTAGGMMNPNDFSATTPRLTVDSHALTIDCRIELEKLNLQWSLGKKSQAAQQLAKVVQQLNSSSATQTSELASIHLKCLLKLGQWKVKLLTPGVTMDPKTRAEIVQIYSHATNVNPKSYQAWHEWGLANYHAAQEKSDRGASIGTMARSESANLLQRRLRRPSIPVEQILTNVVQSLKGLFRAV